MFRYLIRSALLASVVAVATVAAGVPAQAAVVDPVLGARWITAPCATGALMTVDREVTGAWVVNGSAAACSDHVDGSFFALAVYHVAAPGAAPWATHRSARYYQPHKQMRDFRVAVVPPPPGRAEAVCLVAAPEVRIACAAVYRGQDGAPKLTRVDTDNPVVSRSVTFGRADPTDPPAGSPACATCF